MTTEPTQQTFVEFSDRLLRNICDVMHVPIEVTLLDYSRVEVSLAREVALAHWQHVNSAVKMWNQHLIERELEQFTAEFWGWQYWYAHGDELT